MADASIYSGCPCGGSKLERPVILSMPSASIQTIPVNIQLIYALDLYEAICTCEPVFSAREIVMGDCNANRMIR